MKWSVITLFERVKNNNVELCSNWLFHSAAQCRALLWLAVSQCGSMLSSTLIGSSQSASMLSSTLIGSFTVRLNVELYSYWLFHSAAQCWALLWLAVSQCGSMLSSTLIGCFTVWLISVAYTAGRKHREIYIYIYIYISILSHAVKLLGNYTVNKMRALGSRY